MCPVAVVPSRVPPIGRRRTAGFASPNQRATGAGIARVSPTALGYNNITLLALSGADSADLLVPGFDSFVLFLALSNPAVPMSFRVTHLEPTTQAVLWDTGVLGGALPFVFGAFTAGVSTTQRQSFSLIRINVLNQDPVNDTQLTGWLQCSRR